MLLVHVSRCSVQIVLGQDDIPARRRIKDHTGLDWWILQWRAADMKTQHKIYHNAAAERLGMKYYPAVNRVVVLIVPHSDTGGPYLEPWEKGNLYSTKSLHRNCVLAEVFVFVSNFWLRFVFVDFFSIFV